MNEIKVVSLSCLSEGGIDPALEKAEAMIAQAAHDRPDLVCLPELFAWCGLSGEKKLETAERVGGRITAAYGRMAAAHNVHLVAPLLERGDAGIYNSMIWLDRRGKVGGVYRKAFPTDYEMAEGIIPGPLDFDVFETEFGRVGCCICFDLNFREVIERLVEQGARLVLFPSMFQGLSLMQAWAKLNRFYFVSCAAYPYSAVVDPLGRVRLWPWNHDCAMTVSINLDYVVLHSDGNAKKFPDLKKAFGPAVEIDVVYIESAVLLESRHPEKSAMDFVRQFDLELEEDYYRRTRTLRQAKLPGFAVAP